MNKEKKFYIIFSINIVIVALLTLGIEVFGYLTISQKQYSRAVSNYYLEKSKEKIDILKTLTERFKVIEPDLGLIDSALPSDKDTSKILSDLNALASSANMKLESLEPTGSGSSGKDSKKKSTTNLDLLQTVQGANGYELPMDIVVTGSYRNFPKFIQKIENYQRLMNVEGIVIEKSDDTSSSDLVKITMNIKAYINK